MLDEQQILDLIRARRGQLVEAKEKDNHLVSNDDSGISHGSNKRLSRKEALELANSILASAERERMEVADEEARIGLQYAEELPIMDDC